jgi:5-(carboxyamino)imidazole ribonucleotide mutase
MKKFVAVMMGSISDADVMRGSMEVLERMKVPAEIRVLSAHRTPEDTREYVLDAERRGCRVFIAAAGMAAHLAGAVAAQTARPVIGVPMGGGSLSGMDALLSTVQMPGGVPVATVAIGKAGASNAAYLAVQILAVEDEQLYERFVAERKKRAEEVRQSNSRL